MVEANPTQIVDAQLTLEEPYFYNIADGGRAGRIMGAMGASLLSLPKTPGKQILRCEGPQGNKATVNFWINLVLKQQGKVIVNLCDEVGGEDEDDFRDCDLYWPTEDQPNLEFVA